MDKQVIFHFFISTFHNKHFCTCMFMDFPQYFLRINFLEVELLDQRKCMFFILIYIARSKKGSNLHFQVHCMSILKAWKTMGVIHEPDCFKKTQGRCSSYFLNHLWDYLFKCSMAINIFSISCALISFFSCSSY